MYRALPTARAFEEAQAFCRHSTKFTGEDATSGEWLPAGCMDVAFRFPENHVCCRRVPPAAKFCTTRAGPFFIESSRRRAGRAPGCPRRQRQFRCAPSCGNRRRTRRTIALGARRAQFAALRTSSGFGRANASRSAARDRSVPENAPDAGAALAPTSTGAALRRLGRA